MSHLYPRQRRFSLFQDKPSLVSLLQHHKWKKCSLLRDRIFSLLELYHHMPWLRVDHDSSDRDLAKNILRLCYSISCMCAFRAVVDSLELLPVQTQNQIDEIFTALRPSHAFGYFTFVPCSFNPDHSTAYWPGAENYLSLDTPRGDWSSKVLVDLLGSCPSSTIHITVNVSATDPGVRTCYIDIDESTSHAKARIYGCDIRITYDWQNCTLWLSFDALLQLSKLATSTSSCGFESG